MRDRRLAPVWVAVVVAISAIAVAGSAAATSATGSAQAQTLKIGFSGALSGAYAAYDAPLLNGMRFAAKEINKSGGIKVQIVAQDNQNSANQAATSITDLLSQGIRVFVLTTADPSTEEGLLIAKGGGISALGGNTAPKIVSDVGPTAFSIVFGDNVQASAGALYACKQGYRNAYLIGSNEIPYTKYIPIYFQEAFAHDCHGKISSSDAYKIGQTDFSSQVAKIQNAKPQPDVIYTPMFVPDFGVFMKQLRSAGVTIPVVTVDGNDSSFLVQSGGSAVNGVVYTTHDFPGHGALTKQFFKQYPKVMGKKLESNTLEAIGRDNVYALVAAAKKAGSTDPKKILKAILHIKGLKLVTGTLNMNPKTRIPVKPVTFVKMKGTKFTYLTALTPKFIAKP